MATITVTSISDILAIDGQITLREALQAANTDTSVDGSTAGSGADTIIFDASLAGQTITLTSQLVISSDVIITGLGADQLTISGNNSTRIFYVDDGNNVNEADITIEELTLTEGNSADNGGAIYNRENLTINNTTISGNSASSLGGGIYNTGTGIATVNNTTISSNSAVSGGGIVNGQGGSLIVADSIIDSNSATFVGGGLVADDGIAVIFNTTINGNSADRAGGGIHIFNGITTINNTTVSDNSAVGVNGAGGGVYHEFGTAVIENSTISGNSAIRVGGGIVALVDTTVANSTITNNFAAEGGGVYNPINATSTIIAGNTATDNTSDDIGGSNGFISGGNNLIGNGDGSIGFTNGSNGDIVGTTASPIDPGLDPLADNGGATLTHALQADSPAIDTGSNPNSLTTDQRGEVRVAKASVDIGAYESVLPIVTITPSTPNATEGGSDGVFTISRDSSSGDLTVNLAINGSSSAVDTDYSLSGGSVIVAGSNVTVTIPDGSSSVDVNLSAVVDVLAEPAETLQLDIAADANYVIDGVNNSATVTIDASLAPQIVINEIDYDQLGADGDNFIELFNNGTDTINLNGYQILLVNQDGNPYDTINLDNVNLAAGDYYVISNNATNIANTDQEVTFTLQNGVDAVALVFGSDIIDTVSYEGDTTNYTETAGTTVADSDTFANVGLSRFPNGTDTNDNSADFVLQGITPGTVNSVTPTVTLSITPDPATLNDGGSNATITAAIDTYSGKDVTVNLAFSGTATEGVDYTVPNSITIPAGQLSADITLTTVDDFLVEGDEAIVVDIDSIFNGVEFGTEQVNATITDDENSGITVTPTSGLTTEAGGTAEFTIVLDSQPSSLVFINVVSSDTTEGTITSPSIVFDANNWNTPQTVTVTGVDDAIDDDDVIYTISTAATTNDPNYQNQSGSAVTLTNQDDGDTAGVTINTTTLTTSEDLTTDEFTVVLDSQPVADVVVNFTGDSNEGSFVSGVTFTDGNWDVPQTVTVTGVDDFVADGDISYTLTTTVTSPDAKYDAIAAGDLTVTNTDNDVANVTVSPISNNTSEAGDTGTFTIVLDTQPSDDVVVSLASSNTDEGTVDQSALTFTANNWDVPQTVTVTGVDDFVVDGDISYTVTTTVTSNSDTDYNNIAADDVAVTNIDNDTIGVTVTPTSVTTSEAGDTAQFTLQLDTQPTGDVAIALNNSDLTEGTIDQNSLTFTNANWDTPQTVTVTGVDDTIDDGDVQYDIVTSIDSSADADYAALTASDINDVTVTNTNDDEAGVTFTPVSIVTDEVDNPNTVAVTENQASFTVVLDVEPIANVTVTLINNEDEGSLDQNSVIFTPTNWDTPQTVTFTAADDFINDGDITFNIGASVSSGDNAYNFTIADAVSVTNRDNDIAGVNVSTISNNTSEDGTTGEFTVVLDTQPSDDVIVGFSGDANEGNVPADITFTSTNWDVPQTVTVTGVDDLIVDGDVAYTIDTTVISDDAAYDGIFANSVAVTNLDNDTASVIVTPDGNNTSEDGDTSTFSVALSSQPTADVVISFASDNPAEGTVSNNSTVTFTAVNWDTPQDVTVTGVDDVLADGDVNYNVVGTINTTDPNYSSLAPVSVNLNNNDNETADFTISPLSNNTAEDGTSGTFTIVMDAQPTDTVTLDITSSDTTEATIDVSTVTFTPNTWNVPQTVTVTGVDDLVDDGDTTFEIQFSSAQSNDSAFDGIQPDALTATNLDNDEAGFVTFLEDVDTSETGDTASFTLNLRSQPTDDVVIGIASDNPNEGIADVSALTFTSANWDTSQTVTVTGVDDDVADGFVTYNIITSADTTTNDTSYRNLDPVDVELINDDNETAGINFSSVSNNTTEAGDTATFGVSLDSQPSSDVIVNLVSDDTSEGIVDNNALTFSSSNWDTPQTVTVTGVDDLVDDGDIAYTISATATSNDIAYDTLTPTTVTLINEDDDTAGITVSDISNNTSEAGEAGTFTVILDTQPTADVVVNLVSDNTAEGTVDNNTLTFTSDNWNTSQTVTVTGVDDNVVDGDINYSITTTVSSNDTNYDGIQGNPVNIINADNDDPGITFSPVSNNTTEAGGSATFSAVLDSQPSADVVLNLASDDTTEGTVDNNTIIFTTSNWDTPQTVTVTGVDDNLEDGNITYNIVTNITSNDSNYDDQNVVDITLINEDNDGAGIVITQSDGSTQVSEDGVTDTYTVALNTIPTADVNLTFTPNDAEIDLGAGAGNPVTLNFSADATALTPQTVNVAAIDDQEEEDNHTSIIVTSAVSNDPEYNGVNPQVFLDGLQNNQITVAIADNDLIEDNDPDPIDDGDTTILGITHPNDNNIFAIGGNSTDALTLEFSLQTDTQASFVNEVGLFVVDDINGGIDTDGDGTIDLNPGDEGYAEAALASGQVIFTALPGGLGNNQVSSTIRSFSGDSFLSFYLVQNSTTDTYIQNSTNGTTPPPVFFSSVLSNGDGVNHLDVTTQGENDFVIGFEDVFNGGDNDFNDVQLTVQTTTETATVGTDLQASNRLEVFDLRSYPGQFVRGEIEVLPSSDAGFDNLAGIYIVIDDAGTVVDPTTGNRLSPGEDGYAVAARANSVVEFDSNGTNPILFMGGFTYATYLVADGGNGGEDTYFPFLDANVDGLDHSRLLGDNIFSFEDINGGGDLSYDDFVFRTEFTVI